jgi:hypothetical protein
LVLFETKGVSPPLPCRSAIGCLGACGALLSTRLGLEEPEVSSTAVWDGAARMFYSAAVGALAAVIIALFLRLRVVDFPWLHSGPADTTSLAPAAQYIFAFVSGASVKFLSAPAVKRHREV